MTNHQFEALRRARATLADLVNQQQNAIEAGNNLQARQRQIERDVSAIKDRTDAAHALAIRGREDVHAVEDLKKRQVEIESELAIRADEMRLCRSVQHDVDAEVEAARRTLAKVLQEAAESLWQPIELAVRQNAKTRTQLIQIYSLVAAACERRFGGGGGRADWSQVLADAFPHPTDAECDAGIEAARRLLGAGE